ncbi:Uncharacterised protein [Yersinia pseudotuberculosis]|uniref:Uncharacterized protein n=1 Tax=Yersinia pseudotuberculosis serotype O:3 (strain YPIII) TaxID=502800 RepID=A0A0H3B1J8_YERPY|nr:hypothetical protein BZ22_2029 [Yersinia pseudotuberculosis YPIII]KGA61656.1 hypothetical protein DJ55_742 [Yersinia pseudotuberculosis]CFU86289.1 Uncharacterised protein [Yersinia pseudotuberculosis]CNB34712.1 Uncharacterised protein [Yersinia pseudotuberculosis]CNB40211.1 Uncharacterised protein [Yersinia pseudotuberculosis]
MSETNHLYVIDIRLVKCHSLYCRKAYVHVNNKGWRRPSPNKLIHAIIPYAITTGSCYIVIPCNAFVFKRDGFLWLGAIVCD